VRFRLTSSRDIRAASLAERYDQSTGGGNVTDPFLDDRVYIISTMQGGNPNVLPEYADTLTFGVVYQPSWLPDFSASVDVYDIQITDAISLLGLADIVNECFRAGVFCDMINRDASGLIQTVRNIYINIDETRTTGMDIELQYRQPISLFGGDENVRLRVIGSHLSEASIKPYIGGKIDSVGVLNLADWQVMLSATYLRGPLSVSWTENWRSSVKRDRLWITGIDVDNNMIASQSMSNLRVTYGWDRQDDSYSFYGMVTNVFDRNSSRVMGLNNIWGDIGREYTFGVNYKY
jgi:outer membrane receptor protein involved in Fe transport